jgi:hypothetical protein
LQTERSGEQSNEQIGYDMTIEEMQEQHERGMQILRKFMELSDLEIKEKLKSMTTSEFPHQHVLCEKSDVVREIKNENPSKIELWYYDCLVIDTYGVNYKWENSHKSERLVSFNAHFKF